MISELLFTREEGEEILTFRIKHYGKCTLKLYSSSNLRFLFIERKIKGEVIRNSFKVHSFQTPTNFWYNPSEQCWEYQKSVNTLEKR